MSPKVYTERLANGFTFDMICVEGGTFDMGGDDPEAFDREKPVHQVQLDTFYLGKYPVTQALWEAVMGEGNNPSNFQGERRPVEMVSWDDAQDFIEILKEQTADSHAVQGLGDYRLPTEAEWEYAARGGAHPEGYLYAGSDKLKEVGWYEENSNNQTQEVGLLMENELGFYDLSGNVWEWCADWFGEKYYAECHRQGIIVNPGGAEKGSSRIVRGGGFWNVLGDCRVAFRNLGAPAGRGGLIGCRLVLSSSQLASPSLEQSTDRS